VSCQLFLSLVLFVQVEFCLFDRCCSDVFVSVFGVVFNRCEPGKKSAYFLKEKMGRNTNSKRTKRSKRTRAKLVEPFMIKEAEMLHEEFMKQVATEVPAVKEEQNNPNMKKTTKKKVMINFE
jgi:hypothetical protein